MSEKRIKETLARSTAREQFAQQNDWLHTAAQSLSKLYGRSRSYYVPNYSVPAVYKFSQVILPLASPIRVSEAIRAVPFAQVRWSSRVVSTELILSSSAPFSTTFLLGPSVVSLEKLLTFGFPSLAT